LVGSASTLHALPNDDNIVKNIASLNESDLGWLNNDWENMTQSNCNGFVNNIIRD
ncbi:hypothetical protein KI387_003265, partial [Taxus chinensis]